MHFFGSFDMTFNPFGPKHVFIVNAVVKLLRVQLTKGNRISGWTTSPILHKFSMQFHILPDILEMDEY